MATDTDITFQRTNQQAVSGDIPTTFGEVKLGSMLFMASFFLIGGSIEACISSSSYNRNAFGCRPTLVLYRLVYWAGANEG